MKESRNMIERRKKEDEKGQEEEAKRMTVNQADKIGCIIVERKKIR